MNKMTWSLFVYISLFQIPFSSANEYTCVDEQRKFQSWSKTAGTASAGDLLQNNPNSSLVMLDLSDSSLLTGLKMWEGVDAENALLIIPGNAWSTKHLAPRASYFVRENLDVFIFDYRGYGIFKPGNPSITAFISDYKEIGNWLNEVGYEKKYLYAFSFGGLIAMHSFGDGGPFDEIVLDSVPSNPVDYRFKCDPSYEPVIQLPINCEFITVMHGTRDWVVNRRKAKAFIDGVESCGGTLDVNVSRGHPFQMERQNSQKRRAKLVLEHLNIVDAR